MARPTEWGHSYGALERRVAVISGSAQRVSTPRQVRWRLRQITALVGDLDRAVDDARRALGLSVSLRDDGTTAQLHGISNAWMPIGATIFELASPAVPGDATSRFHARFGDGGYMVILQASDLEPVRRRLDDAGVTIDWEIDYPDAKELHLSNASVGGTLLAIDWAATPDHWRWAGPDWPSHIRTHIAGEILAAEISVPDPARAAARWAEVVGGPLTPRPQGVVELALDRGALRFVPSETHGRGRLTGVDVSAGPAALVGTSVTVAGLQFRFVEPSTPSHWWEESASHVPGAAV